MLPAVSMNSPTPSLIVVRSIQALDPSTSLDEEVDVVIEQGVITRLGRNAADQIAVADHGWELSGKGKRMFPGLIDMHVHFRDPGHEYKEDIASGLAAAAAGGFVHVCPMANTKPINDRANLTAYMKLKGKELSPVGLHPVGAITMGQQGQELTEMADIRDAGALAVSDDGVCVRSSAVMRKALEYARTCDLLVIQHAEDHDLTVGAQMHEGAISTRLGLKGWPRAAEEIIVARDLILAELTGARYHLAHVSSAGSVRLLRDAKDRGIAVSAEVTPHHLLLTDSRVLGYDTACKVNPPLREEQDRQALWEALLDGTIDVIATDHAPHSTIEKDCEFSEASPGLIGLELCMALLFQQASEGRIRWSRLVESLSQGPADLLKLPRPQLKVGQPANFAIFDEGMEWKVERSELASKSWNTPFLGQTMRGRVVLTMAQGKVAFCHRDFDPARE
jgi:dihydroorotase